MIMMMMMIDDDYDKVCVPLGELSVRRQNGVAVDQGGNYIFWISIIIITATIIIIITIPVNLGGKYIFGFIMIILITIITKIFSIT